MAARTPAKPKTKTGGARKGASPPAAKQAATKGGARRGASLVVVMIRPGVQVRLASGRWARAEERHELARSEAKVLVAQGVAELDADAERRENEALKALPGWGRRLLRELERAVDETIASMGGLTDERRARLRERTLRSRLEQLRASDRQAWRAILEAIAEREREPLGDLVRRLDDGGHEIRHPVKLDGPDVAGLGRLSTPPPLLRDRSPSPG